MLELNNFVCEEKTIKISKKVVTYTGIILILFSIVATGIYRLNIFENNKTEIIRVSCMGNSITRTNYPNELQSRLGEGYMVGNFGSSGSTVLLDTYKPYIYQTAFLRAKNFQPKIVVLMLGTNDARKDNFRSIDNFKEDYLKLIREIQSLQTNPQIFLVKPPPIFDNNLDLEANNFSEEIIPRIERIADEFNFPIIDVYSKLENFPEYFRAERIHCPLERRHTKGCQIQNRAPNI